MMRYALALVAVLLMVAGAARAQTDTPTPTPTTGPWLLPTVHFELMSSPTPIPTATQWELQATAQLPTGPIYDYLATTESNLAAAPAQIDSGLAVLPHLPAGEAFGYAKWLIGTGTTSEVFGPFAIIVQHVTAELFIIVALATIYLIIFLARFVLRFINWLITNILKIIPFFG